MLVPAMVGVLAAAGAVAAVAVVVVLLTEVDGVVAFGDKLVQRGTGLGEYPEVVLCGWRCPLWYPLRFTLPGSLRWRLGLGLQQTCFAQVLFELCAGLIVRYEPV